MPFHIISIRRLLGVFVLSLLGLSTWAQSKSNVQIQASSLTTRSLISNKVSGMVQDESHKPLGSITVCLIELPAKTSFILARTNTTGNFIFQNVPAGSYLVQTIEVGRQKKLSEPFTVDPIGETNLKPIIMGCLNNHSHILDSLKALSKSL